MILFSKSGKKELPIKKETPKGNDPVKAQQPKTEEKKVEETKKEEPKVEEKKVEEPKEEPENTNAQTESQSAPAPESTETTEAVNQTTEKPANADQAGDATGDGVKATGGTK